MEIQGFLKSWQFLKKWLLPMNRTKNRIEGSFYQTLFNL